MATKIEQQAYDSAGFPLSVGNMVRARIPSNVWQTAEQYPWEICEIVNIYFDNGTPILTLECRSIWHRRKACQVFFDRRRA